MLRLDLNYNIQTELAWCELRELAEFKDSGTSLPIGRADRKRCCDSLERCSRGRRPQQQGCASSASARQNMSGFWQMKAKGVPQTTAYSSLSMNGNVTKVLSRSRIYRGYAKAFTEVTGLPLLLRPVEPTLWSQMRKGESKWTCASLGHPHCSCKCCAKAFARMS